MNVFQGPRSLETFYKTNPISLVMIILISISFLMQSFLKIWDINLIDYGAVRTFDYQIILQQGQAYAVDITLNTEFYRFVSAIFLHGDFLHFAFNTFFGFLIIGASLERTIGPKKYLATILVTGIGASIVIYGWNYFFFEATSNAKYLVPTIGASGVVYGFLGFLLYLTLARPQWFSPQDISSIRGLILINVIFTILVPNISLPGHLGGLFMGMFIGKILTGDFPYQRIPKGFANPYDPYYFEDHKNIVNGDYEIVEDDEDEEERRYW